MQLSRINLFLKSDSIYLFTNEVRERERQQKLKVAQFCISNLYC